MTEIILGFVLRFLQSLASAAPTILVGVFVAGVLERLFGYHSIKRIFGSQGWRSLLAAWAIGMLLPVCSLGTIPILRVMRRAGLSGGTILAFALAAPLFNPLSLLYGLTLSRPLVVFSFAGCSLVLVTAVGLLWDHLFPGTVQEQPAPPPVAPGLKRMAAVGVSAVRELVGPSLWFMLAALMGSALLAAVLPHGTLQRSMNGDNSWAPLTMAGVALPVYATPMLAMSQLGSMFQHGNSVGAAFVLLTFGTGVNVGLFWWMLANYGWRRSAAWLGAMVLVVLGLAYAVDKPLYPADVDPADHTHAFDIYTSPFAGSAPNPIAEMRMRLDDSVRSYEWRVLYVLGGLLVAGVVLRSASRQQRLEAWLTAAPSARARSLDIRIPAPVMGFAILAGLVGMSVLGCYIYYPPPQMVFEELQSVRAEALYAARKGDRRQTDLYIALWDESTRKLEVGAYLRQFHVSDYQRIKARILREKLELLRHEVEDGDQAAAQRMLRQVNDAYDRLRRAFDRPAGVGGDNSTQAAESTAVQPTHLLQGAGREPIDKAVPLLEKRRRNAAHEANMVATGRMPPPVVKGHKVRQVLFPFQFSCQGEMLHAS